MLLNEIRLRDGVSYNMNTGEMNPRDGYMVALPNHERIVHTIDEETIKQYINDHLNDLSKENAFFGCWFDGHDFVLDVSECYERKRDAIFYALVRKQKAIWDNSHRDEIRINARKSLVKQYVNN
jgi:hypothetical protein